LDAFQVLVNFALYDRFPCFVQINDSRIFGSPQQFTFDKLHTLIMLREWSEAQAKVGFGTEEQAIFNTSSDASPTLQFEVYRR
jgi:hypothetical protein